jgi:hypothetical protein
MSKTYLKIKIKSLAAEARIIRHEEKKWPGPSDVRLGLHSHRVNDVRSEARAAQLAYGYLRGRSYSAMEFNPHAEPNWGRVAALISKYGPVAKVAAEAVLEWSRAAELGNAAACETGTLALQHEMTRLRREPSGSDCPRSYRM